MDRNFWKNKALSLLEDRSLLWISGVRRVGKTTLCKAFAGAVYLDCELPRVRASLEDAELFFRKFKGDLLVLDEVHRLMDPSEVLKIATDHFAHIKVVATGSSTLMAKSKFRDSLTGRKHEMWLLPAICADMKIFGINNLDDRILKGGLPPFLLANQARDRDYIEWLDSYWAKDVQELFTVEKRASFLKFIELLFRQSGDLFEAQAFAAPCEIARQTVQNYLGILETTLLVTILRPYSDGSAVEIKSQPKIYGFDTGFVCFFRAVSDLSDEERGRALEHLVLNELIAHFERREIFYWRDKQKHEVDFVVKKSRGKKILAIECKSTSRKFSAEGMLSFRQRYPEGENFVVCFDRDRPETKTIKGLEITFCGYLEFAEYLSDRG